MAASDPTAPPTRHDFLAAPLRVGGQAIPPLRRARIRRPSRRR
jgi:hypothetical protein